MQMLCFEEKMNIDILAKTICKVAQDENDELSELTQEGIYHMPELAFAYQCGKEIIRNSLDIFGTNEVKWSREEDLRNGGPTDLTLHINNDFRVAIEFKMRDTASAYESDIKKLSKLKDNKTIKIFCALVDVLEKDMDDDGRQRHIENLSGYEVLPIHKMKFKTKQNWYKSQVYCVACVWSVGNIPEMQILQGAQVRRLSRCLY